ncbi:MAG: hypothetical protein LBB22_05225 [Treponema sp.]|nr:hypothetical protein [Treponema sp.]
MKKQFAGRKALVAWLIAAALLVAGCSHSAGRDGSKNPFLGKWESKIPSMDNAVMVSEYKTDGTFTASFPDLPKEYGGGAAYTGAYLISGNILVTFLSTDGGISGYSFETSGKNTINVTEIDGYKNDGSFIYGNTAPFTRYTGSTSGNGDRDFTLTSILAGGTWKETMTPYLAEYQFNSDGTGILKYAGEQAAQFKIAYSTVYDSFLKTDILIVFMTGTNTFTAYSFDTTGKNTITAAEIETISMGAGGQPQASYGYKVTFTRTNS